MNAKPPIAEAEVTLPGASRSGATRADSTENSREDASWRGSVSKARDHAFCDAIVKEHYERIFSYLHHLCGDEQMAADLCQETFLKVWKGLGRFRGQSRLRTWIFRIARNTFVDEVRKKRPRLVPLETEALRAADPRPSALTRLLEMESMDGLKDAVEQLPEREKTAIVLHYHEGLSYRQLSKVLDVPTGTAKYTVSRGLALLRGLLADSQGGK